VPRLLDGSVLLHGLCSVDVFGVFVVVDGEVGHDGARLVEYIALGGLRALLDR